MGKYALAASPVVVIEADPLAKYGIDNKTPMQIFEPLHRDNSYQENIFRQQELHLQLEMLRLKQRELDIMERQLQGKFK